MKNIVKKMIFMQNSSRRDLTNESCDLAVIKNPVVAFFQEFQIDFLK